MKKFNAKNVVDMNANISDIASIHMTELQNFLKEKFNATCSFNCLRTANESTFVCNVSIYDYIYFYSLKMLFLISDYLLCVFFHFLRYLLLNKAMSCLNISENQCQQSKTLLSVHAQRCINQ